jgi:adenosylhomocysteine nucleosidase
MTAGDARTRVGMLAPMQPELQPLVRRLGLTLDGAVHRGRVGDVEIVAMLTNIGMAAAADAARRILEHAVDWVMVVGIAGGVDPSIEIGDVVAPEVVVDRARGRSYRPHWPRGAAPGGTLSCGDDLILDPTHLARLAEEGVVALDMETAAVAAVCEEAGCPWSVFRAISDRPGEGLIDDALFALTRPDGTADTDALARYLDEKPERLEILTRLARDAAVATEAAAAAAVRACTAM